MSTETRRLLQVEISESIQAIANRYRDGANRYNVDLFFHDIESESHHHLREMRRVGIDISPLDDYFRTLINGIRSVRGLSGGDQGEPE